MEDCTLTNYTPHDIDVYDINDQLIATFPSRGNARLNENEPEFCDKVGRIPCHLPYTYGQVDGLDCTENIIVSAMVAAVLASKGTYSNVYSPDTGKFAVRKNGAIIGTRALIKWC